jgi:hypothetical protein
MAKIYTWSDRSDYPLRYFYHLTIWQMLGALAPHLAPSILANPSLLA